MSNTNKITEETMNATRVSSGVMRDDDLTGIVFPDGCETSICESDRAQSVLSTAVGLYEDLQRAYSSTIRVTHLEEVSKLTGVSAPIILYAYKHGVTAAHDLFVKEDIKEKEGPTTRRASGLGPVFDGNEQKE